MPCNGGSRTYYDDVLRLREELKRVGRASCDMRTILRRHSLEGELAKETRDWISEHDEEDKKRIEEEERRGEREKAKQTALDKLTMDERRILGL